MGSKKLIAKLTTKLGRAPTADEVAKAKAKKEKKKSGSSDKKEKKIKRVVPNLGLRYS